MIGRRHHRVLAWLAAAAVLGCSVVALGAQRRGYTLPLRIHVLSSDVEQLDAASVVDADEVRARLADINRAFAPADLSFELESLVVTPVADSRLFVRAVREDEGRNAAMRAFIESSSQLAPRGFDLVVARHLGDLDIGGAWLCKAGGRSGKGIAYIGARTARGKKLATRKWAHELGHALGLGHTPCDAAHADRLMMSGRCEHAKPGRIALGDDEIRRIRKQAVSGTPAPCRK